MNTTARILLATAVTSAILSTSGCLLREVSYTLYLDRDGSVEWIIAERHVRSGADSPTARAAEESEFVENALAGEPFAEALHRLGATRAETRLVRDRRPYSALTQARFESIQTLGQALVEGLGARGQVRLTRAGDRTELLVALDPSEETAWDDEHPATSLWLEAPDLEQWTIILTAGAFVEAEGFELREGDTVAVPRPPVAQPGETKADRIVYRLSW